MSEDAFVYWYVSVGLIALGALFIVRRASIMRFGCYFRSEMNDPSMNERLAVIFSRRRDLEGASGQPFLVCGALFVLFGAATLARLCSPELADALGWASCAIVFAVAFGSIRNRGERRAAPLRPRRVERVIPAAALAGGVISALLPLSIANEPGMLLPSLIATAAGLIVCASAWSIADMAAVIVGDDSDLEIVVDERIRRARANVTLVLGYAVAPTFLGFAGSVAGDNPAYVPAVILSMLLLLPYADWFLIVIRGFGLRSRGAQA